MSGPDEKASLPGGLTCEEALTRVYEYLDGELDPEAQEQMNRHLEACRRCHPRFDFQRRFLDAVYERGLSVVENPELASGIATLLDEIE
ncbi:MAG: anti-sigma factor family protein [Gemmatimonadota bacterium]